jgi:hypothetical protein
MTFSDALHLAQSAPSSAFQSPQTMEDWLTTEIFDHPDFDEPCIVKASITANELAQEVASVWHFHN